MNDQNITYMQKGISILAKKGTNERMIVFLDPRKMRIQKFVNNHYDGEWVQVNELCLGDIIKFESADVYNGFDNRKDDNYCQEALIKHPY